jgi:putative endonuclease
MFYKAKNGVSGGSKKEKGDYAEQLVADMLVRQGFIIIGRNIHSCYGEIDIIARKDQIIACVEVKMRHNPSFDVSYLITPSKQRKIIATAKKFIVTHGLDMYTCRFDVVFVTIMNNAAPTCEYIPHAFSDDDML